MPVLHLRCERVPRARGTASQQMRARHALLQQCMCYRLHKAQQRLCKRVTARTLGASGVGASHTAVCEAGTRSAERVRSDVCPFAQGTAVPVQTRTPSHFRCDGCCLSLHARLHKAACLLVQTCVNRNCNAISAKSVILPYKDSISRKIADFAQNHRPSTRKIYKFCAKCKIN